MSRHRNLRKVSIGDDDYDDDISQSFDEKYSYAVSPGTSEMYMFNRNNDQTSMSDFIKGKIMEEDDDNNEHDHDSAQALGNNINTDEKKTDDLTGRIGSLDVGLVKNVKSDEDFVFQMDKDSGKTTIAQLDLNEKDKFKDIKKIPIEGSKSPKPQMKQTAKNLTLNTPQKLTNPVVAAASVAKTPINKSLITPNDSYSNLKQLPQISSELKMHASPSTENFKKAAPVVDRETLLKQYDEYVAGKDVINLIVIGHVDSGKSTLMGHLLYQLGQVSQKQMHKYKQESQKIGKSSFAYAWVLDETEEERSRGVTIDVAQTKFETDKKIIYLLDAPGHKDFIPNMITGATQADSAILVINSVTGEFETGFDLGGQTREHSLLVKSLGINQLIVAVNKMDMCDWSQERFQDICKKLGTFLIKQVGFKENDIYFVPCSGLHGENLTSKSNNSKLNMWYDENYKTETASGGITLIDCINRLKCTERSIDKPLRFSISDVFKSSQTAAISLAGKIETGWVKLGDRVLIVPANESGLVKGISINDEQSLQQCFAGDSVILNVANIDMNKISVGNFVCDCIYPPMPVTDRIRARIIIFNLDLPIVKGFSVVFHYKSLNEAAIIKKLVAQLDKTTGEVVKEKPRILLKGMTALVEIKISKPICVELYANYRELGRFMLRRDGTTIAAGQITETIIQ